MGSDRDPEGWFNRMMGTTPPEEEAVLNIWNELLFWGVPPGRVCEIMELVLDMARPEVVERALPRLLGTLV